MGFRTWLIERRLASAHQKMKRLHALQKKVREAQSDLERRHRAGMADDDYEREKSDMEARKAALTEQVNTVHARETALKDELLALDGERRG